MASHNGSLSLNDIYIQHTYFQYIKECSGLPLEELTEQVLPGPGCGVTLY